MTLSNADYILNVKYYYTDIVELENRNVRGFECGTLTLLQPNIMITLVSRISYGNIKLYLKVVFKPVSTAL